MTAPLPSPVKFQSLFEKGHCFPGMPGLVQERKSSFQQEFGACLRRPASYLVKTGNSFKFWTVTIPALLSYFQLLSFMTDAFFFPLNHREVCVCVCVCMCVRVCVCGCMPVCVSHSSKKHVHSAACALAVIWWRKPLASDSKLQPWIWDIGSSVPTSAPTFTAFECIHVNKVICLTSILK